MAAKKPASNWLAAVGRRDTAPREPLDEAPQDSVEQAPAEQAAAVEASHARGAAPTAADTAAVTDATSTAAATEPASAATKERPKTTNGKTTTRAPRTPRVVADSAAPVAPTVSPDAPAPSTPKTGGRRKVARKAVGYRLRVPAYELIEDVYNALWEAGEEPTKDDLVSAAILAHYGLGGSGRPAGLVERTEP